MPTNEQCPQCGKQLFLRKSRNTVLCHDKQCGYKREEPAVTKQEEETEE